MNFIGGALLHLPKTRDTVLFDMTTEEKFKGIVERLKAEGWCDDPSYISVMVIIHYLDKLQQMKIVECAFTMTPIGTKIADICEEFDWKPSDLDVRRFVDEMVEEKERPAFAFMIKKYRDDREGLLEEIKESRKQVESEQG